jgi:hypothetical protein
MDMHITSFSTFKAQPKTSFTDNPTRFTNFNKSSTKKSKKLLLPPIATEKVSKKKLNNILILSKKTLVLQPKSGADKKGVLLYQQVERNKLFSNRSELINRFHHKV